MSASETEREGKGRGHVGRERWWRKFEAVGDQYIERERGGNHAQRSQRVPTRKTNVSICLMSM